MDGFPACPSVQQVGSILKPKRNVASLLYRQLHVFKLEISGIMRKSNKVERSKKQFRNEFSLHYPDMRLFVGLGEFRESEKVFDKSFGW